MSIDIKLKKVDRIYRPGEKVEGLVVIRGKPSYNSLKLYLDATVNLQLSAKSVGLFEAFYNSVKPIQLLSNCIDLPQGNAKPGKLEVDPTEIPFQFQLDPPSAQQLYETYHGVFVNITYMLRVDMIRGMLAKNLQKSSEFIVEVKSTSEPIAAKPLKFEITPESLENIKKGSLKSIPKFKITGQIDSLTCNINRPFTGKVVIEEADFQIKSIELQLVRVETCGCLDGYAKEATEIQNIQISEGDVPRGVAIPIFMVFPQLFTAPTIASRNFKIEFEVNLVVMLTDGKIITENFAIKLIRTGDENGIGTF